MADNISRIIENRRIQDKKDLEDRKREVYENIPRIKTIDKTITSLGTRAALLAQKGQDPKDYKEKLKELYDEKIKLLASNGMLIKRPLLITEDTVLIGFKENEWKEYFEK